MLAINSTDLNCLSLAICLRIFLLPSDTLCLLVSRNISFGFFFFFWKSSKVKAHTKHHIIFAVSLEVMTQLPKSVFFFFVLNGSREDLPTAVSLKPGFSLSYTRGSTGLMAKWHTSDAHKQGFGALEKITLIITGHIWTCPPEKQGRRSRSKRKPHPLVHSSMLCHTGAEFPHGDFQGEAAQGPWRNA